MDVYFCMYCFKYIFIFIYVCRYINEFFLVFRFFVVILWTLIYTQNLSLTHGNCLCKIVSPWDKIGLWTYAVCRKFTFACFVKNNGTTEYNLRKIRYTGVNRRNLWQNKKNIFWDKPINWKHNDVEEIYLYSAALLPFLPSFFLPLKTKQFSPAISWEHGQYCTTQQLCQHIFFCAEHKPFFHLLIIEYKTSLFIFYDWKLNQTKYQKERHLPFSYSQEGVGTRTNTAFYPPLCTV